MEFFFVALLVAFALGLGTGLYFGRVQSHLIYRAVLAGLIVPSLLLFVSSFGAYIINTNYFPHEDHRQNLVWAYASLSIAVLALVESIFCFIPRMFRRAV
jgi:hypothetical protein